MVRSIIYWFMFEVSESSVDQNYGQYKALFRVDDASMKKERNKMFES